MSIDHSFALVIVLYGAPGTGKSTLCERLLLKNSDATCRYRFATIDEPTGRPEIASLLKAMYKETPTDWAAGRSVAARVQTDIMEARFDTYSGFVKHKLFEERAQADASNRRLVVVCDGHILTDDKLYAKSKHDARQISEEDFSIYQNLKLVLWYELPNMFARPAAFVQLKIDNDSTGVVHHKRVCEQRNTGTEADVDPAVFARLDSYADYAWTELLNDSMTWFTESQFTLYEVLKLQTNGVSPEEVCTNFISLLDRLAAVKK